jgi:hypothetical protein
LGVRFIRRFFQFLRELRLDRSMYQRVVLIFIAFIVPLSGAAVILIKEQTSRITSIGGERDAIRLTMLTSEVVSDLRNLHDQIEYDHGAAAEERSAPSGSG